MHSKSVVTLAATLGNLASDGAIRKPRIGVDPTLLPSLQISFGSIVSRLGIWRSIQHHDGTKEGKRYLATSSLSVLPISQEELQISSRLWR